ncbi:DUF1523 family protein [Pseudomonas sp. TH31]|uniref:DUF1523 family protein n=1 Tax=Pseudomonas sp. TH31 TaxID=2796396 RepID=UPI00191414AB|nr:DUF1523 family protein [Pseudomonas sp. TH31]MBK5415377.1 DUF1523 family protein [Pseudomonas sp. TH31]
MKYLKSLVLGALFLVVGAAALGLYYALPQHEVVLIIGVEVKRIDDGVINAENPVDGPTRDVYFINTEGPRHEEGCCLSQRRYRLELPWYLKFDSADEQAKAQGYSRDAQQLALIRYYGWRIQILSVFPNITHIEATTSREQPFPWFNTIFFTVTTVLVLIVAIIVRLSLKQRGNVVVS